MANADPIEVVWLVIISCCVMLSSMNMWSARSDNQRVIDAVKKGLATVPQVRVFMVKAIYDSTRIILFGKALIFMAAVWAVNTGPPPPSIWTLPQSAMNAVMWTLVSFVLMIHALMSMKWRRQLSLGEYQDDKHRRATDIAVAKIDVIEARTAAIDEKTTEIKEVVKTLNGEHGSDSAQ